MKILKKEELARDVTKLIVEAAVVAQKVMAGQFVAVIVDETGERIPLTIADWDASAGTITLIFQKVGYTTKKLGGLEPGQEIAHILGPLGHPTDVRGFGSVVCIGGGVGIAEVYPVSRAFKQAGSRVTGIIGSRQKDLVILEKQMRDVCDELIITTDDGSYCRKGFVTDVLKEILLSKKPDLVYAIGPVPMMKAVSEMTRPHGVKTVVSLNPIMVDATGMCGSCRCKVAGKTVFGCVDGPDFDGHQIDFDDLQARLRSFAKEEKNINEK